ISTFENRESTFNLLKSIHLAPPPKKANSFRRSLKIISNASSGFEALICIQYSLEYRFFNKALNVLIAASTMPFRACASALERYTSLMAKPANKKIEASPSPVYAPLYRMIPACGSWKNTVFLKSCTSYWLYNPESTLAKAGNSILAPRALACNNTSILKGSMGVGLSTSSALKSMRLSLYDKQESA